MSKRVPEAEFLPVYEEWCDGGLTRAQAAARLRMSARTFGRYVAGFRAEGSQWWQDRSNRVPDRERTDVQALYSGRYSGWSVRHFHERYRDEHGGERSYSWIKDVLQAAGLVERGTRNGTSNRGGGVDLPERGDRMPREGMLVHVVVARHEWVPGSGWDLICAMDDASDVVHSGFFVEEVGIWSVFKAVRQTLDQGLFGSISLPGAFTGRLTDGDSTFGGRTRSQLKRAMSELQVDLVPPSSRSGARRRRMIGTVRRRLPQELAAGGIAEIDQANSFLAHFWTRINRSLGKPTESPSAFDPMNLDDTAGVLRNVLCLKHPARCTDGSRLICKGKEVALPMYRRQQLCANAEYRILEYEDGSSTVWWRGGTGPGLWKEFGVAS